MFLITTAMDRRRLACLLLAALPITALGESAGPHALSNKASPKVVERIEATGSCKVLIRLAARELTAARRRETDEIYADRSTTSAQKQALNDAAGQRYRAKLTATKAAFTAAMDSGEIEVIGDVPSGPEVQAIVRSLEALGRLTTHPSVEFVFAEETVKLP
jgi:hypothetical protein